MSQNEYERGRRDINDLCEAISRIRWARGTSKLDEAIFEAVRIQSIIDSSRPLAATSGTPAPSDPDPWIRPCPRIYSVQSDGTQVAYFNRQTAEQFISEREEPAKFKLVEYVPAAPPPADETLRCTICGRKGVSETDSHGPCGLREGEPEIELECGCTVQEGEECKHDQQEEL